MPGLKPRPPKEKDFLRSLLGSEMGVAGLKTGHYRA